MNFSGLCIVYKTNKNILESIYLILQYAKKINKITKTIWTTQRILSFADAKNCMR